MFDYIGGKINQHRKSREKEGKENETEKSRKSRSEKKTVDFSSASVLLARKWEAVTKSRTI